VHAAPLLAFNKHQNGCPHGDQLLCVYACNVVYLCFVSRIDGVWKGDHPIFQHEGGADGRRNSFLLDACSCLLPLHVDCWIAICMIDEMCCGQRALCKWVFECVHIKHMWRALSGPHNKGFACQICLFLQQGNRHLRPAHIPSRCPFETDAWSSNAYGCHVVEFCLSHALLEKGSG